MNEKNDLLRWAVPGRRGAIGQIAAPLVTNGSMWQPCARGHHVSKIIFSTRDFSTGLGNLDIRGGS